MTKIPQQKESISSQVNPLLHHQQSLLLHHNQSILNNLQVLLKRKVLCHLQKSAKKKTCSQWGDKFLRLINNDLSAS